MRARPVVLAAVLFAVATGCGGDEASTSSLTVLAASSLTEALDSIVPAFEAAHGDVDVTTSFAGSSALAAQIEAGAPGDVFVAADETTMAALEERGLVGPSAVVARNRLTIVVEEGNPASIEDLADLARDDLLVVLCAPEVPCGRYAARALAAAGVEGVEPRSLEENVKAVVSKVALGEADAGIVYASDVRASAADVDAVDIDGSDDPRLLARYPAAVVRRPEAGRAARAFVDFLRSPRGQALLEAAGFLPA
jgi:molybdate transport system substrate-binding protein